MNVIDTRLMEEFYGTAGRLSDDFGRRYERVAAETPETPVSPQDLRSGVELARELIGRRMLPHSMLYALSAGLSEFPQIRLQSIEWIPTDNPAAVAMGGDMQPAETTAPPVAESDPPGAKVLYQVALLKADIKGFDGDYKAAFALVNRFVEALKRQRDVTAVEALEMPLNTQPTVALQGRAGLQEQGHTAVFAVKAVLRVKHAAG